MKAPPTLPRINEEANGTPPATLDDLKDAYSQWLHDLHTTNKTKEKRRSKKGQALRQLQQPTTSSAQKHISSHNIVNATKEKPVDPVEYAVARSEAQRRRFQALADEINYAQYQYEPPWEPGLHLFALMARHARTQSSQSTGQPTRAELRDFPVKIPPTVMQMRESDCLIVVVLFTSSQTQGEEVAHSAASSRGVVSKDRLAPESAQQYSLHFHYFDSKEAFVRRLAWVLRTILLVDTTPVQALWKQSGRIQRMRRALCSSSEVEQALLSLWDTPIDIKSLRAVQKYISCKSSVGTTVGSRVWLARSAYRKRDHLTTNVWIVTATSATADYVTTTWDSSETDGITTAPCQIVKCANAQSWRQPREIVEALTQWFDLQLRAALGELVIDVLQDTEGQWWLLQVKAFQRRRVTLPHAGIRAKSAPDRLETLSNVSSTTRRKCVGKYCDHVGDTRSNNQANLLATDDDNTPSGFLTKKELLSCEFYDRFSQCDDMSLQNGCVDFAHALAFYLQHQLRKRDRTALYEPQPLCLACLQRYYNLRTQYLSAIEPSKPQPQARNQATRSQSMKTLNSTKLPALTEAKRTVAPLVSSHSVPSLNDTIPTRKIAPAASYLDELASIERLLAQHDSTSTVAETPTPAISIADTLMTSLSVMSWSNSNTQDRVDEMWERIQIRPLPAIKTPSHTKAPTPQYNSFSLEHALSSSSTSKIDNAFNFHTVSVNDVGRIFSDDEYVAEVVRDAVQRLTSKPPQGIRYVVLPNALEDSATQLSAMARMALGTLYLDLTQAMENELGAVSTGSRAAAPITDDPVGGCVVLTILASHFQSVASK